MSTATLRRVAARSNGRSADLSQGDAFELLSCRRRRYVIHYLKQRRRTEPVAVRDLVERIAAWENDVGLDEVTRSQRMRVYTALRQSHLPKLNDSGVVRYDSDRGTVELTEVASSLEVYLDVVPHDDIPWSKYYVGLGVLCTGLLLGIEIGVAPFGAIDPLLGAGLITALFTLSATAHVHHDERMRLGTDGPPPKRERDGR
ncbi:DUF7344 domain-containing protein [Natrinema longum]|uniref:DUF7344 domain-containing protein n=1 Tax=Natrinema longum TaxID=370324 RepID=A0A8A2UCY4_9EURY|nr:hypothetical protein [Natrinema longum]MBZ6495699.1 hypothetical protein [Natrinema longum]QSW86342.1 hypothetical protein J0X27_05855 [Natrinema longum]